MPYYGNVTHNLTEYSQTGHQSVHRSCFYFSVIKIIFVFFGPLYALNTGMRRGMWRQQT